MCLECTKCKYEEMKLMDQCKSQLAWDNKVIVPLYLQVLTDTDTPSRSKVGCHRSNGVTFITDCSPYSNSGLFSKTALDELTAKDGRTD